MKYVQRTFTLPASSGHTTSQVRWDLAFLSIEEFVCKYGVNPSEYEEKTAKWFLPAQ